MRRHKSKLIVSRKSASFRSRHPGQWLLGAGAALLATLGAGSYWYVFVAGVPQLDGPEAGAVESSLSYKVVPYDSAIFGAPRTYGVVLPPGYDQNPQQRYPVIFLLHGGHGDPTSWFQKGAALPVIEQLFRDQRLPLAIVITPDGNDTRGTSPFWDPQYIDGPNGKVLTAIGDELVQVVKSRYRTKPEPQFWAMGGLSSGGWGAMNIGLQRVKHFSVLFSHSGYFTDVSGPENSPMLFVSRLSAADRKRVAIYLDAGEGDGKYLNQSRKFHQKLDALGIRNVFNAFPGGHGIYGSDVGWNYWHRHLADSLSYVGKNFQAAEAQEQGKHK